jgi:hypothetical protein
MAKIDKTAYNPLNPDDDERSMSNHTLTLLGERLVRWDIKSQTFVTDGSDGKSSSGVLSEGDF